MSRNKLQLIVLITCSLIIFKPDLLAQDSSKSLVLKTNRPLQSSPFFYQPDLAYEIWQQFKVMQAANAGDPLAMHELGMRYLLGQGIAPDTLKAAFWIKQAADKEITSARYNYGILCLNGWGVDWNPFEAYKYFLYAASDGMPQSQYVIGLLNTDNLIIRQNWEIAYYWIKKSADAGFEPAKDILQEIIPKVSPEILRSDSENFIPKNVNKKLSEDEDFNSSIGLVFIDFDNLIDSIPWFTNSMLIEDLTNALENDSLLNSLKLDSTLNFNAQQLEQIKMLGDHSCPEALTILGKSYEYRYDDILSKIKAAENYIRAIKLDSYRSRILLYRLISDNQFNDQLNRGIEANEASALYVWYGLNALGLRNDLTPNDIITVLQKASAKEHLPSIVELGLNYYTGNFVSKDFDKVLELWKYAESRGSIEARLRIFASAVFDRSFQTSNENLITELKHHIKQGSILAQIILAKCYEEGFGTQKRISEAVKNYRWAAQRGNNFAFTKLKEIYNSLRPADEEFKLD